MAQSARPAKARSARLLELLCELWEAGRSQGVQERLTRRGGVLGVTRHAGQVEGGLGGLTRLDTMERAIDEGFAFVALGRALIREPDLVQQMQAGKTEAALCQPCNRCIVEMDRGGTRCVMRPRSATGANTQTTDEASRITS